MRVYLHVWTPMRSVHVFVCTHIICVFMCTEYNCERLAVCMCELCDYVHTWVHCVCLRVFTCVWPGLEARLAPFQVLTGETLQLSLGMA